MHIHIRKKMEEAQWRGSNPTHDFFEMEKGGRRREI